jgi:glycosyltransferase involved in cell wall biosynthesis
VADECIVVDSGSTDATLHICQQFGLTVHHHAYTAHGAQMNYAIRWPAMTGCCAWIAMKFLIMRWWRPFWR